MRVYCKFCELQAHPPSLLDFRKLIEPYVRTQLRFELTLRGRELAEIALTQKPLTEPLVWEYFGRVECGIMKTEGRQAIPELPDTTRLIFKNWLAGEPIRNEIKRSRFYKHRRIIMDRVGADISLSPEGVRDQFPRINLDRDWLMAREIKQLPDIFNKWLWRPQEPPDYKIGES